MANEKEKEEKCDSDDEALAALLLLSIIINDDDDSNGDDLNGANSSLTGTRQRSEGSPLLVWIVLIAMFLFALWLMLLA